MTPYFPANEPSKVTVKLIDGSSFAKTVICSKGTPNNPMSREELEVKFKTFASRVIPPQRADKAIELIRNLDALTLVRDFHPFSVKGKVQPRPDLPAEGGELPDCAGIIAALEAVTLNIILSGIASGIPWDEGLFASGISFERRCCPHTRRGR